MSFNKIVLIGATFWELRALISAKKLQTNDGFIYARANESLVVYISGIGAKAAHKAAHKAVLLKPDIIASTGYAGSLHQTVNVGDLIIDTTVSDAALAQKAIQAAQKLPFTYHAASTYCASTTLQNRQDKADAHKRTQALAVEMESAPIAAVAQQAGIAFLSLRAISDAYDQHLPECVNGIDAFGKINPRWFLYFLRCPNQWLDFFKLILSSKKAEKAITQFWLKFLEF